MMTATIFEIDCNRCLLLQIAQQNDPQASRQALGHWSRILYPDAPSPYEQLCRQVPEALAQQLQTLDRALYGSSSETWSGQQLAEQLKDGQPTSSKGTSVALPDLYE